MDNRLTHQQLNAFRDVLNRRFYALRAEIRDNLLRADDESYAAIAGQVTDIEDASLADLIVDLNLAGIDRNVEEIRDVDAALMRIAQGSYGQCSDCDEAIPMARLQAYPTASRCQPCQPCQQHYEHTHPRGSGTTI